MFSSCFRQRAGSLCEGQAVPQPSHSHHPRATLKAEGQEKAHGAVKGWPAKPGAGQHGNKQCAHCEGHIPVKPAQKQQSHFANFVRVCHGPLSAVTRTQAHTHCVWPMNQHRRVLGLMNFLFSRQKKDLLQTSFSMFSILDKATDFLSYQKQRCHKGYVQRQVANRADSSGLQIPKKYHHKSLLILEPWINDNWAQLKWKKKSVSLYKKIMLCMVRRLPGIVIFPKCCELKVVFHLTATAVIPAVPPKC